MANVLTDLAADIYKAADIVGRELVGVIPSSTINSNGSEEAAQGDSVRSHATRAATVVNSTASMTIPEGTDQTVDNKTLVMGVPKSVQIPWTGEDMKHVNNGSGFETVYGDQIKQAMRAHTNAIELAGVTEAYTNASRAVGTAGTTPFASNFDEIAEVRQILADNGMPMNDGQMSLVLNTAAGTKLRNLAQLQKANEAGGDALLRQGILLDLQGLMIKESGQITTHTKGTGTGYLLNDASAAVGDTAIATDTGSGTLLAGDIVTFAGDTNKYVANSALAAGSFNIGDTGLRTAVADDAAITIGDNYVPNIAMHRNALELAIRPVAEPVGGDAAVDRMTVEDPHSGLIFVISAYKGYKKAMFDVSCIYGWKAWNSDAIAILAG